MTVGRAQAQHSARVVITQLISETSNLRRLCCTTAIITLLLVVEEERLAAPHRKQITNATVIISQRLVQCQGDTKVLRRASVLCHGGGGIGPLCDADAAVHIVHERYKRAAAAAAVGALYAYVYSFLRARYRRVSRFFPSRICFPGRAQRESRRPTETRVHDRGGGGGRAAANSVARGEPVRDGERRRRVRETV